MVRDPAVEEVRRVGVALAQGNGLRHAIEEFIEGAAKGIGVRTQPPRGLHLIHGSRMYLAGEKRSEQIRVRIEGSEGSLAEVFGDRLGRHRACSGAEDDIGTVEVVRRCQSGSRGPPQISTVTAPLPCHG